MTFIERVRGGSTIPEVEHVARSECVSIEMVSNGILDGTIVIPCNPLHTNLEPRGVGKGLRTKVNANLGTSSDSSNIDVELRKLAMSVEYGADAVMDLSTGGDSRQRVATLSACPVMFGTGPLSGRPRQSTSVAALLT